MRATVSIFRRHVIAEEQMIRAAMPRTSAADPEPLVTARRAVVVVANRGNARLVKVVPSLTFTLAEVTRG